MKFSELIKTKRKQSGMTLEEVADAAGLSKSYVWELEAGKNPNPGLLTCVRLSLALGLAIQVMAAACLESNMAGDK